MNKKTVNSYIPKAKQALEQFKIAEGGKISKNFRGQISSFGAAVVMGSLPAAVAFFADQGSAEVDRSKLVSAMYYCVKEEEKTPAEVLEYVCKNNTAQTREDFINASIALKLAMNFFVLIQKGDEA